jgi:hypothetical protein
MTRSGLAASLLLLLVPGDAASGGGLASAAECPELKAFRSARVLSSYDDRKMVGLWCVRE